MTCRPGRKGDTWKTVLNLCVRWLGSAPGDAASVISPTWNRNHPFGPTERIPVRGQPRINSLAEGPHERAQPSTSVTSTTPNRAGLLGCLRMVPSKRSPQQLRRLDAAIGRRRGVRMRLDAGRKQQGLVDVQGSGAWTSSITKETLGPGGKEPLNDTEPIGRQRHRQAGLWGR